MLEAALYLIPVTLGDTPHDRVLPSYNREVTAGIRHFIVENVRSARRFLKRCDRRPTSIPLRSIHSTATLYPRLLRGILHRLPTDFPSG